MNPTLRRKAFENFEKLTGIKLDQDAVGISRHFRQTKIDPDTGESSSSILNVTTDSGFAGKRNPANFDASLVGIAFELYEDISFANGGNLRDILEHDICITGGLTYEGPKARASLVRNGGVDLYEDGRKPKIVAARSVFRRIKKIGFESDQPK